MNSQERPRVSICPRLRKTLEEEKAGPRHHAFPEGKLLPRQGSQASPPGCPYLRMLAALPKDPRAHPVAISKNVFRPFKLKRSHGKQKGHIWSEWHVLLCQTFSPLSSRIFSTFENGISLGLINCLIYFPGVSFLIS